MGKVGWPSRQLTAPLLSPCNHWMIASLFLSHMKIFPQSLPLIINSEHRPKKFTPLIVCWFLKYIETSQLFDFMNWYWQFTYAHNKCVYTFPVCWQPYQIDRYSRPHMKLESHCQRSYIGHKLYWYNWSLSENWKVQWVIALPKTYQYTIPGKCRRWMRQMLIALFGQPCWANTINFEILWVHAVFSK